MFLQSQVLGNSGRSAVSAPLGLKAFHFSLRIRKVLPKHLFLGDSSCWAVPGLWLAALLPLICASVHLAPLEFRRHTLRPLQPSPQPQLSWLCRRSWGKTGPCGTLRLYRECMAGQSRGRVCALMPSHQLLREPPSAPFMHALAAGRDWQSPAPPFEPGRMLRWREASPPGAGSFPAWSFTPRSRVLSTDHLDKGWSIDRPGLGSDWKHQWLWISSPNHSKEKVRARQSDFHFGSLFENTHTLWDHLRLMVCGCVIHVAWVQVFFCPSLLSGPK